jgi:2,3-bisphosphoglycerate-independent phosphoglycerate mutase
MTPEPQIRKTVILLVLDGWGLTAPGPGNAISQAQTVNVDRFWASFPHTELAASGDAVGLPKGEPGNTETGHLNLGAGRIVYQDLARINTAIADGSFFDNSTLAQAIDHAKTNNSNLHLMGLIGAGGVHSNLEHLYALIEFAKKQSFDRVFIHLFTDGRDSPPTSAKTYVNTIREVIKKEGIGTIASIMGRYWAMDRDRRWDRTAKAYFALTKGTGHLVKNPEEAIDMSYSQGETDEFIQPALISSASGTPISLIKDNDSVIFYNFRIDRPRQLTAAFIVHDFGTNSLALEFDPYMEKYEKTHLVARVKDSRAVFNRGEPLKNLFFATMTEYSKSLVASGARVVIPPEIIEMPLGRVISERGLRQLRLAESEKERFVTFYFNGQNEKPYPGEERVIIPSPEVATYDLKPEMSAREITERLLTTLREFPDYSFVLVNFANPDMVAHTGSIGPTTTACQVVDECVGQITNFVLAYGGAVLITGDHGNAEAMINPHTGQIDTEHNKSNVPFIAVSKELMGKSPTLPAGVLADVAPTLLGLLGIPAPSQMTGRNLLAGI